MKETLVPESPAICLITPRAGGAPALSTSPVSSVCSAGMAPNTEKENCYQANVIPASKKAAHEDSFFAIILGYIVQGQSELLKIKSNIKAELKVSLLGILPMPLVGKFFPSEPLMAQWPHK